MIAFFIMQAIVGNPDDVKVQFKSIDVISKDVAQPSSDTFNTQALNPTVEVFVGDTSKDQDKDKATSDNVTEENKEDTSKTDQTGE
ncbi:MAG: hypothetical protein HUJ62_05910 [Streptococcus gallolyticus]|nr:hypothetical protein [Streptococcus gallolyticus]